ENADHTPAAERARTRTSTSSSTSNTPDRVSVVSADAARNPSGPHTSYSTTLIGAESSPVMTASHATTTTPVGTPSEFHPAEVEIVTPVGGDGFRSTFTM